MDSDRIGKLHRSGEGRVKLAFEEQDSIRRDGEWQQRTLEMGDSASKPQGEERA